MNGCGQDVNRATIVIYIFLSFLHQIVDSDATRLRTNIYYLVKCSDGTQETYKFVSSTCAKSDFIRLVIDFLERMFLAQAKNPVGVTRGKIIQKRVYVIKYLFYFSFKIFYIFL